MMDGSGRNVLVAYQDSTHFNSIKYTFKILLQVGAISWKTVPYSEVPDSGNLDLLISYGYDKPCSNAKFHIHIYESDLFSSGYLRPESMPSRPLEQLDDLPIIYRGTHRINGHVRRERSLIETDVDIIASSFFMLTRYEEVVSPVQDRFERFPATASLAYKEGFLHRPIVNEYIELLWSWIEQANLGFERRQPWGSRDFAVCLTHDVDVLRKYNWYPPLRAVVSWTLKHRKPGKSLAIVADYLRAKLKGDPYDKFDYLMMLSQRSGLASTFYFLSGGETDYDQNYQITEKRVLALMKKITGNGFEIGLHTSFAAYKAPELVIAERAKLESALGAEVAGCRQHYLRWKTPESWRARELAGFKYDTSLSFADHEGFRCGICTPFKPFDIIENRELDIWELPLTLMEVSFYGYQGLSPEEGFGRAQLLIDTVKKYNGVFVLLWHNSSLDDLELPGWRGTYERILGYLAAQNVLGATVKETIHLWEERGTESEER